jgi:ATP-dependent helicase HrpA
MAELGLGDVESFPFIDPPDRRAVRDAVALLVELQALVPDQDELTLTRDGRRMARLPVDPRFGRMLLAAEADGCLREVTVIVAALSIQDPRERPTDEEQKADEQHARFRVPGSDFLAYLNLWEHLATEQRARTGSAFRRMCRSEYLNYVRVREWQDLVRQLREVARDLRLRRNDGATPASPDAIHRALLAGLLSHVGTWDRAKGDYRGARQARFSVASRSSLAKSSPAWLMAGELVETGRLWARTVARIDPSWIEPLAEHLVKRSYGEPGWHRRRGQAVVDEQVTLYGLPIVPRRSIAVERLDDELARALFVEHALVEGDWDDDGRYPFTEANRQVIDKARGLEARARRADLVVGPERLATLYSERLPGDMASTRAFDRWWRGATRAERDRLTFSLEDVLGVDADDVDTGGFPLTWTMPSPSGDLALGLSYVFEPGADDDGVTVHVPLVLLPRVTSAGIDWHVPGHRLELVTSLIRSLPKAVRRELSPAHERAREALDGVGPADGPLVEVLARRLRALAGVPVAPADLDLDRLPRHLRMRFAVEDTEGRVVAVGRDIDALASLMADRAQRAIAAVVPRHLERRGLTGWPEGGLPRTVTAEVDDVEVFGYPALYDEGATVAVRIATTPATQQRWMWAGTRRLLTLAVPKAATEARRRVRDDLRVSAGLKASALADLAQLSPGAGAGGSALGLAEPGAVATDCVAAAADRLITARGGPAWDDEAYHRLEAAARDRLVPLAVAAAGQAAAIVAAAARLADRLRRAPAGHTEAMADMRSQLGDLVYPGFVAATGLARLPDLARYLEAIRVRLGKRRDRPDRDRELMATVRSLEDAYAEAVEALPPARRSDDDVVEARWLLEELRVSLFAQTLGTPTAVSPQRLARAIAALA